MAPGTSLPRSNHAFVGRIRVGNAVRHKDGRQGIVTDFRVIGDGELCHALVDLTDGTHVADPLGYFEVVTAQAEARS